MLSFCTYLHENKFASTFLSKRSCLLFIIFGTVQNKLLKNKDMMIHLIVLKFNNHS